LLSHLLLEIDIMWNWLVLIKRETQRVRRWTGLPTAWMPTWPDFGSCPRPLQPENSTCCMKSGKIVLFVQIFVVLEKCIPYWFQILVASVVSLPYWRMFIAHAGASHAHSDDAVGDAESCEHATRAEMNVCVTSPVFVAVCVTEDMHLSVSDWGQRIAVSATPSR